MMGLRDELNARGGAFFRSTDRSCNLNGKTAVNRSRLIGDHRADLDRRNRKSSPLGGQSADGALGNNSYQRKNWIARGQLPLPPSTSPISEIGLTDVGSLGTMHSPAD